MKYPLSYDEAILTRPNIRVKNNLIRIIRILIHDWQGNGRKVCKRYWKNRFKESRLEGVGGPNWVLAKRRKRWGRGGAPLWLIAGGGTFTTLPTRLSLKSPIFAPKNGHFWRRRWGRVGAPLWLITGGGAFTTLLTWWPWSFMMTSKPFHCWLSVFKGGRNSSKLFSSFPLSNTVNRPDYCTSCIDTTTFMSIVSSRRCSRISLTPCTRIFPLLQNVH